MSNIEVVIAVHTDQRPIRRAVASALASSDAARALVVAHNIDGSLIRVLLEGLDPARVRVIEFHDGIRSPAGPFNAGIEAAQAQFITLLGSDDELEPGSLDAARQRLRQSGAEICILPVKDSLGSRTETPLARAGRTEVLDVVRDRLFSRTAPLCLAERKVFQSLQPVFDPRFRSGEDIATGVRLWTEHRCVYARSDPGYVVHSDAGDRVTAEAVVDLRNALDAPTALAGEAWVAELPGRVRQSLAAKMIRVHLLGVISADRTLSDEEFSTAREFLDSWLRLAPGALRALPLVERQIVDRFLSRDSAAVHEALAARGKASLTGRILTRNPLRALDRDGVLRRYLLYRAYRQREGV